MKNITIALVLMASPVMAQESIRMYNPPVGAVGVLKSGDTMTGPLTLAGSSLTVTGSAFSVGTSTFVVTGGRVGVGGAPTAMFDVYGTTFLRNDVTLNTIKAFTGGTTPITIRDILYILQNNVAIGTSLNGTTSYLQIDTLSADTAGPPAAADCDAATEVGRMVLSSRYTATADNMIWVCLQTGAATYAWWKTALTAP